MSAPKDPAIKLFGKTIQTPDIQGPPASDSSVLHPPPDDPTVGNDVIIEDPHSSPKPDSVHEEPDSDKAPFGNKVTDAKKEERTGTDSNGTVLIDSNPKTPSAENETSKTEVEQSESSNSQDKTLKKPDKILPCPRCNSMDTKFCYYNNYNVNQPRHFCKKCQRYWTAGGTMRNVPVGAGRRKNKNSVSQYRQISVPNPVPAANTNGTVLAFGSDSPHSPLCESMSSVLKIAEKTTEESNGEDHSSGSSSKDDINLPNYPPQVQFFPPWPYPWNPVQWNPAFCPPPGFTMPFYPPPPYWGCTVPVQWIAPPPDTGPTSPTLGKHSRTGEEENNTEKCLWFPKTLRIDDPREAAKSSILATLGIQDDKDDSFSRGGSLFKAFGSKGDEKNRIADTCPALQANPAALSRSLNFHESS